MTFLHLALGGRKVVSHLSGYKRVKVVSTQRWRSPMTGLLQMSSQQEKDWWCKLWWRTQGARSVVQQNKRWARVCLSSEVGVAETESWRSALRWSSCFSRRYVARIDQGSVFLSREQHGPAGNALTVNATHSFPAHLLDLIPSTKKRARIQRFDEPIAHSFGALSLHAAHLINQIPRLATLAFHAPKSVTLLVLDTRMHRQFVDLLRRCGVIQQTVQFVPMKAHDELVFSAPAIYFTAEAVGVDSRNQPVVTELDSAQDWYTLQKEICSFQLTANRSEFRFLLDRGNINKIKTSVSGAPIQYGNADQCEVEVLVVSREDAKSRQVDNHPALLRTVRDAFHSFSEKVACIRTFVGKVHDVASTEYIWRRADVVIAPHGAALAFMLFMRPKTFVIEFGYHAGRGSNRSKRHDSALGGAAGMPWPAPYYWLIALSADVQLIASMAQGSYNGNMLANLSDVEVIIRDIIQPGLLLSSRHI